MRTYTLALLVPIPDALSPNNYGMCWRRMDFCIHR